MSSFTNAVEAGKAFLKVVVDDADVAKGFERVQAKLNVIGQKMQKWGAIASGVSATVVGTIGAAAKSFASAGAAIDDMTKRTGFSAKALGELSYAAAQSGTDLQGLEKAVKGMEKFMLGAARGGAGFTSTLAEIGVALEDIQGQSPERQFEVLSEAIAGIDDPTQRAGLAMKVFGKAGSDLLPMLIEGKDGIAALRAEAQRLGLVFSEEDVAAAAKLDDALARLSAQAGMAFNQIGAAVAGPLTDFGDKMSAVMADVIAFIKAHPDLVVAIGSVGSAATLAGLATAALGTALAFTSKHPAIAGLALLTGAIQGVNEWLERTYHTAERVGNKIGDIGPPRPLTEDEKKGGPYMLDRMGNPILNMTVADYYGDNEEAAAKSKANAGNLAGRDLISLGPLSSGGAEGGFGNLLLGPALGMTMPGKGGAKLKRRLAGWADAAAGVANAFNPLGGLGLDEAAGKAARFGKRALSGEIDAGEMGSELGKKTAKLLGGIEKFFGGNVGSVSSLGTFNAGAVAGLQTNNLDQQMLNVLTKSLGIQERMERKGDGWGAS